MTYPTANPVTSVNRGVKDVVSRVLAICTISKTMKGLGVLFCLPGHVFLDMFASNSERVEGSDTASCNTIHLIVFMTEWFATSLIQLIHLKSVSFTSFSFTSNISSKRGRIHGCNSVKDNKNIVENWFVIKLFHN